MWAHRCHDAAAVLGSVAAHGVQNTKPPSLLMPAHGGLSAASHSLVVMLDKPRTLNRC